MSDSSKAGSAAFPYAAPRMRTWLETLQARNRTTLSIERAEDLVTALEAAEAAIKSASDLLDAIRDAAREWVRVYDATSKTSAEWGNGMQRLRIALAEADRD